MILGNFAAKLSAAVLARLVRSFGHPTPRASGTVDPRERAAMQPQPGIQAFLVVQFFHFAIVWPEGLLQ